MKAPQISVDERAQGDIRFERVTLRSEDDVLLLDDVSFTCPHKHFTVITGGSELAEAAIFSILQRHSQPQSGRIVFGAGELNHITQKSMESSLSRFPEQRASFSGTIGEIMGLNGEVPDFLRLVSAARDAGILNWVDAQPHRFSTWLWDGGVTLANGYYQRLLFARAFYREASVLLLDRAFLADAPGEPGALVARVRTCIQKGITVIAASSHPAVIAAADNLVRFANGRVIPERENVQGEPRRALA